MPVDSPTIKSRSQRTGKGRPRRIVAGKLNKELKTETLIEAESDASSVMTEIENTEDGNKSSKSDHNLTSASALDDSPFTVASNPAVLVKAMKENVVEIKIPEDATTDAVADKSLPKAKKMKQECYVKAPPASLMEQFVTVHIPSVGDGEEKSIPVQLIPTSQAEIHIPNGSTAAQIQITPSANSAFQPITIFESQPVTLTVSQQEQLQSLGVTTTDIIDLPVDIVTVSEEQAIVCSEVVNTGSAYTEVVRSGATDQQAYINTETGEHIYVSAVTDVEPSYINDDETVDKQKYPSADTADEQNYETVDEQSYENNEESEEQMYVTVDSQIGEFETNDGDEVLQGADNLMNAAVEILPSGQVHEISLANVQWSSCLAISFC